MKDIIFPFPKNQSDAAMWRKLNRKMYSKYRNNETERLLAQGA
jgi:hypothetical protein